MHLFLNGLAASAGGGLTYLRNVVPELSKREGIQVTLALSPHLCETYENLPNVSLLTTEAAGAPTARFWHEQTNLGPMIAASDAEVLISAGNFALRNSPVPQILLSGNSLYTSNDFRSDLRSRGDYWMLLDTIGKGIFAKRSIKWADRAIAPSEAFARELTAWSGVKVSAIHHGFDRKRFFQDCRPLPRLVQEKLAGVGDALCLLFVSHYNYYRNFETLLSAIPLIQGTLGTRPVMLFLTCSLEAGKNPGSYRTGQAAALVQRLNIKDNVVELGAVPYEMLHRIYSSCHIYITAAYTETFAHPLVEAMASGLPIVASDLPVHREICGEAALYFDRFSPEKLAAHVCKLAHSDVARSALTEKGLKRSGDFSWQTHVNQILALADAAVNSSL